MLSPDLVALREANARRARVIMLLRRVYAHGPRPNVEMMLAFAEDLRALERLERIAQRYADHLDRIDPQVLHEVGADRFPPAPIWAVSR